MSSDFNPATELSGSQRKKLAAAEFNASRNRQQSVLCSKCHKPVMFKAANAARDGIYTVVTCASCDATRRPWRCFISTYATWAAIPAEKRRQGWDLMPLRERRKVRVRAA